MGANLVLDLARHFRTLFQEDARIVLALADTLAVVAVPGARFFDDLCFDAEVDDLALARRAFSVQDVEVRFPERRRDLVLDDLDAGLGADHLVALLDRADAAKIGVAARHGRRGRGSRSGSRISSSRRRGFGVSSGSRRRGSGSTRGGAGVVGRRCDDGGSRVRRGRLRGLARLGRLLARRSSRGLGFRFFRWQLGRSSFRHWLAITDRGCRIFQGHRKLRSNGHVGSCRHQGTRNRLGRNGAGLHAGEVSKLRIMTGRIGGSAQLYVVPQGQALVLGRIGLQLRRALGTQEDGLAMVQQLDVDETSAQIEQDKHVDWLAAVAAYGGEVIRFDREDIIEELVGEIADEYDEADLEVVALEEGGYRVAARYSLFELGELFEIELEDEDVDSVGGLLAKELGRLPVRGDEVKYSGLIFRADRIEGRRRRLVSVLVNRDEQLSDAQEAFGEADQ